MLTIQTATGCNAVATSNARPPLTQRAHRGVLWAAVAAAGLLGASAPVHADTKAAVKRTNAAFAETHFVAKLPLVRYAHLYVLPDGTPSDKKGRKKQGLVPGGASTLQLGDGVKVGEGETGESILVYVKGKELIVGLNKKRGSRMNPASVHILYDRPVAADDITPHKVALAISGVAEIVGYEPGSEVEAAFATALGAGSVGEQPERIGPPTVLAVRVTAEPASVQPGGEVVLQLTYEVQTPGAGVETVESVDVTFGGASVPGYPRTETVQREPGTYTVSYRQRLPAAVQPGTYAVRGEVCVRGDCISRSVDFELLRPDRGR